MENFRDIQDIALYFERFGMDMTAAMIVLGIVSALVLVWAVGPVTAGVLSFVERKVAGHIQARYGPNRAIGHGFSQWIADGIKLFLKEDIVPNHADSLLFRIAPYLVFLGMALALAAIPFGGVLLAVDINLGIYYILAVTSITVVGIMMSGWASNNKWSLLGGLRAAAQVVSYEIPTGLSILVPVMMAGTLSMQGIVEAQMGSVFHWFIFQSPFVAVAFVVYFIAALAEINRTPFDLPEAESELVSGYNTEYSGMRFSVFFMAEFANILVVSVIAVTLFLGGWHGPFGVGPEHSALSNTIWGVIWLMAKTAVFVLIIIQLRWTVPRLRIDQMMSACWKYLVPIAFVCIVAVATVKITKPIPIEVGGVEVSIGRLINWGSGILIAGWVIAKWMTELQQSRKAKA